MTRLLGGFGCGLLFSLGLVVSGMIDPAKVLAFLDLFGGAWNPSLALVMAAALAVALPGFRLAARRRRPVFDDRFHPPRPAAVDMRLVAGAGLFGVGWGMSGYCPGPAVAALALGDARTMAFAAAMLVAIAATTRLR